MKKLLYSECIFLMAASPSILVALLICCSARNTALVGDLYPASSQLFSSFCLFPNSCNQRLLVAFPTLLLFQKVHHRPESRQVVRPSVVMNLVSFTRSSHAYDES